jgi:hypothetical protein
MDTVTKVIVGALIAVFAACAAIIYLVTRDAVITLVFTGLATSGMTGLMGISYGSRLSGGTEIIGEAATTIQTPAPTPPAPTTP